MIDKKISAAVLLWVSQSCMAAAWDPMTGGFYVEQTSTEAVLQYFDHWKTIMTAPDCRTPSIDRKHVSSHALQGARLGDICLLPEKMRQKVTQVIIQSMVADEKRFKEAHAKAKADGKLKEWETEMNQKHVRMLKQGGGMGWVTQEFDLGPEEKVSLEVSTFIPASRRAYASWIRKSICGRDSNDNLLDSGPRYAALVAEYGKPAETVSQSQYRAEQYEQRIVSATKLADSQEKTAKTEEEIAAAKLLREEIKLLSRIRDTEMKRSINASNQPVAYQWKFDGYSVSVHRAGECEGQRPRYVMRLSVHGSDSRLFAELTQASKDLVRKAMDKKAPASRP
jgi:hypothetical protein